MSDISTPQPANAEQPAEATALLPPEPSRKYPGAVPRRGFVNSTMLLLLIDDNPGIRELHSKALAQHGVAIVTASGYEEGLEIVRSRHPEIVMFHAVPGHPGALDILGQITDADPAAEVIVLDAQRTAAHGVSSIRILAADYASLPIPIQSLRERVSRVIDVVRERKLSRRSQELPPNLVFDGIVGQSPRVHEMFARLARVAPHYRSLLITGETGTGKDLVARAAHALSPALSGRYVVLNCSAVVETLFESELFGHAKGSFTGATGDKPGLFEHADGGTLFLDEIGDMPLASQAKLLRVLQNQEVQRVGSLMTRKVDVRVIAATHHDLRALIAERQFREDLYYRISMVELEVPRLADRKEDLPIMEQHFITRFAALYKKEIQGLTHRADRCLAQHSWPGNIRELENVIGHAAMMTDSRMIDLDDLPLYLRESAARKAQTGMCSFPGFGVHAQHRHRSITDTLFPLCAVMGTPAP